MSTTHILVPVVELEQIRENMRRVFRRNVALCNECERLQLENRQLRQALLDPSVRVTEPIPAPVTWIHTPLESS